MEEGSSAKRFKAGASNDGKKKIPTDMEIKELSLKLAKVWKYLGTRLKLDDDHLSRIDRNNDKVQDKAETMLTDWRNSYKGENAYETLSEALEHETVGRNDLASVVRAWASAHHSASRPPSVQTRASERAQPGTSSDHTASGSSFPMETVGIQETDKPDGSGDDSGQPYSEYRMDRNPRGRCLIINNEKFKNSKHNRPGSNVDEVKLTKLFKKLHFKVEVKKDKTADGMNKVFEDVSSEDHSQFDCFVCCILSHGRLGEISGTDGKPVKICNILEHFKDVKGLNGKPKLFFIQACQGSKPQDAVVADYDPEEAIGVGAEVIPKESDFLISYSTVSGYVAYRNQIHGSWYVGDLVEEITENHTEKDLLTILTEVNRRLCLRKTTGKDLYQIGAVQTTLRRPVNLRDLSN